MKDKNTTHPFIKETEGVRPAVNDPRTKAKVRAELSKEELHKQEQSFKSWADKYSK